MIATTKSTHNDKSATFFRTAALLAALLGTWRIPCVLSTATLLGASRLACTMIGVVAPQVMASGAERILWRCPAFIIHAVAACIDVTPGWSVCA